MRLRPVLVREARRFDPLLSLVLLATRNIPEAQQELRWLKAAFPQFNRLLRACWLRSHQYPLQYLLKSQPFLQLDIQCRPGVLIPRWETEEWCAILGRLLRRHLYEELTVLDLCTGTGCIPFSMACYLKRSTILAIDISDQALDCFRTNQRSSLHVYEKNQNKIDSIKADVLDPRALSKRILEETAGQPVDLITANPPYISDKTFHESTSLSVKRFEPHLALKGDLDFYEPIVDLVATVKAKALICEVGTSEQIDYVARQTKEKYNWQSVDFYDSSGNPRLVITWDPSSKWSFLSQFAR